MSAVLTVSQINTYIKSVIDYDDNLKNIYVSGEISNFTNHYRTGHFYFTLKDASAQIKCVMFRTAAQRVRFQVENGMKVLLRANVSVFERDGVYQLYVDDMQPDGVGALNLAFEQLKQKLFSLGLFDAENKKPIPRFPEKIGVITSPTGAAVHDILTVLERRYPYAQIVFEGVAVQGDGAAAQIVRAIEKFNRLKACDVLIVGRGGGSIEDLWSFNEESVAYAIFQSEIPVISAVGHETDFTIADFVSDVRAATPSAAAEIAAPDYRDVLYTMDKMADSMNEAVLSLISSYRLELAACEKILAAHSPKGIVDTYSRELTHLSQRLGTAMNNRISEYCSSLSAHAMKLDALNPLRIMSKGYCIAADNNGFPKTSASSLSEKEEINLIFADGRAQCTVESITINQ